jgi:ABC-2 type transport system ATP-binding protein/lipopolysaccharide transport system ATP-binding protein
MAPTTIEVAGLGKRYVLGAGADYTTLREHLARPFQRGAAENLEREIWALRDVSLSLEEGDVLGVIGPNGAGKSTLLKILARITEPTEGVARMRGRLACLLEVGTGFHEDLTGRENVYLNGAVLGMSRREIDRRFDEIVDFSGVGRFLGVPIKRYSSGMKLRLAFAVAAHLETEIVVVDEILAVGDAEFQRRCLAKMAEFRDSSRTVLFVSHDLAAVARLCPRAVWLDSGRVQLDGPTDAVVSSYLGSLGGAGLRVDVAPAGEDEPVRLRSVALVDPAGAQLGRVRRGQPFGIEVRFGTSHELHGLDAAVYLVRPDGIRIFDEALSDAQLLPPASPAGDYRAVLHVPADIAAGEYVAGVWIGDADHEYLDRTVLTFELEPGLEDTPEAARRRRVLHGAGRWTINAP